MRHTGRKVVCAAIGLVLGAGTAQADPATAAMQNLQALSLEDLGNIEITSVSKTPENLGTAPAAIYVITHDDIIRSGASSIPEMLRLAPNLQVAQTSPSNYVITARGFSGNSNAQNFSDKLLVLIDGRSVYNPLFSGMYWDMQYVPPEDIERIEVISGPGATLWGANAVNGVINIVTRKAADTQGGVLELGWGNHHESAGLQYGGTIGDDASYRVYGNVFKDTSEDVHNGGSAHDGWSSPQGGFRLDWTPGSDQVTVEGDLYNGREDQGADVDQLISGGNLVANWQHKFEDGSSMQVLAYYDRVWRMADGGNGGFTLDTYNIEAQHNFTLGTWNKIVWGVGERFSNYDIVPRLAVANSLIFDPQHGQLNLADIFVQDTMSLSDNFDLTLGLKLENDTYSGLSPMPDIRATWRLSDDMMLWAAVSHAIRSPTPFDTHVVEKLGATDFLNGNPDFAPEKVIAYELGYRQQLSDRASISVSAFDSIYNNLKTIEPAPGGFIPLYWGNGAEGDVYGVEAWASYQPNDWWRLSAGLNLQNESLKFKPLASGLLGISQQGNDPHHQAFLRSSMNISDAVSFDTDFRYVGMLPDPHVPSYIEANARIGWAITDKLELSLSGYNLLHDHHQEFAPGDDIKRSFFIDTRLKF